MEEKENSNLILAGIKRISPQARAAFWGTIIIGLFAQGTGLFNKFSHHDEVATLFDVGTTVSSGRWMLQVFKWLEEQFFGTVNSSLPLYNGMISILCIGVTCGLLVHLFKIRNQIYCALLGGVMAAFPVITALFAYMFTSHPYMISLLMMTVSAFLICRKTPWWVKFPAICIGGAAVGIYQAYLPVFLTIILFYDILTLAEADRLDGAFWKRIVVQMACILGVMLFYLAANRFFLYKYQIELSGYQGISEMGQMTVWDFLDRVGVSYREFVSPTKATFHDMYPGSLYTVYRLMLAVEVILALRLIVLTARKGIGQAFVLTVLFALVPLGCNFIFIMTKSGIHGLMVYGQVMQIVLFVCLVDQPELNRIRLNKVISLGATLVMAVMTVMYIRYDNQCYLKDTLHQQEAISYFTTLITRIKSQPGYRPEMEIYFTDTESAERLAENDPTVYNIDELDFIRLNPYWHNSMEYIHTMTRPAFMKIWCGADFTWSQDDSLETRPEVQAMPTYPADGSIQIIDDVVVVRF